MHLDKRRCFSSHKAQLGKPQHQKKNNKQISLQHHKRQAHTCMHTHFTKARLLKPNNVLLEPRKHKGKPPNCTGQQVRLWSALSPPSFLHCNAARHRATDARPANEMGALSGRTKGAAHSQTAWWWGGLQRAWALSPFLPDTGPMQACTPCATRVRRPHASRKVHQTPSHGPKQPLEKTSCADHPRARVVHAEAKSCSEKQGCGQSAAPLATEAKHGPPSVPTGIVNCPQQMFW